MRFGHTVALEELNLSVPYGEIFGLVGHTGAGKTTAINILSTLVPPTSGTASLAGHRLDADHRRVRRLIGYLPEHHSLGRGLTVEECMLLRAQSFGLRYPDVPINEALHAVGLTGAREERVSFLSPGMRKRVGIALIIVHRPVVLFLDDPASGLDPQAVAEQGQIISRLNQDLGMTVFICSRSLAQMLRTCTSIGVLQSGHLVYQASVAATQRLFPDATVLGELCQI